MKLLVLSEISGFNPSLVRKNINSVLESENIDVVILLGGLFKSKAQKTEKSANSRSRSAHSPCSIMREMTA